MDGDGDGPRALYLDLLKKVLTRYAFRDSYQPFSLGGGALRLALHRAVSAALRPFGLALYARTPFDAQQRAEGRDWPAEAETMIGLRRLENLERCIADVLRRDVPGDFIETGVWRGGATIFMRAALKAHGDTTRRVWLADSFRGLPRPDTDRYPADGDGGFWSYAALAVPLEEVRRNFARYGLLDEQVCFLPGWFRDTLPSAPIERLAVLRLDGDLYESTMDALGALYPKLSVGGYVIVDDYALPMCRAAVEDYRRQQGITEPITPIDWTGIFWRRER
jgi:O-methyltransferase